MYTQQSSRFEPIAELMLGIGLVEMRHYDKLSDFLQKADPHEQDSVMDIYPKVEIGFSPESALKIAWNSEIETIGNYKKIMNSLALYSERADYDDVMYLLNKLIADEEHHIKLIKEAMGVDDSTKKGVTTAAGQTKRPRRMGICANLTYLLSSHRNSMQSLPFVIQMLSTYVQGKEVCRTGMVKFIMLISMANLR